MDEILKRLEGLEGGKELVTQLREKLAAQAADTDALKAAKAADAKALKALQTERDKLAEKVEAAGKTDNEQLVKLQKDAEKARADLESARGELKAFKVETKLAAKLAVPEGADAGARRAAALKLLDRAGVDLDDKGELVGADAAIAALTKEHAYLFTPAKPPAQGNGGPPAGGVPPGAAPPAGGGQTDVRAAAAATARAFLQSHTFQGPGAAQQQQQQQQQQQNRS